MALQALYRCLYGVLALATLLLFSQYFGHDAKAAQSLADPTEYENLFPGLADSFKTEQFLTAQRHQVIPAAKFSTVQPNHDRQPVLEMKEAEESGDFTYVPGKKDAADDADDEGPNSPPPSPASDDANNSLKSPSLLPSSATPPALHATAAPPAAAPHASAPAPSAAAAAAVTAAAAVQPIQPSVETVKQSTVKTPPSKLDDMELDLDLEIENMKLDENIDPSAADINLDDDVEDWE
jgi:coatomer subunit beta'